MPATIWIGTSGWSYPHWRKRFYPEKLPSREWFRFYASRFKTVELNNSFYRQPSRERFEAWGREAPDGFCFAVKGSRYISHVKRIAAEQASIDRVVESAEGLGPKLGPILFQFQSNFRCDLTRLDAFLPRLTRNHRFSLEFRHESWLTDEVFNRLRDHGVTLCIPEHPKMPQALLVTANFSYVRMHMGARGIGFSRSALETWAERIKSWRRRGIDVYVYFNNDAEGYAIRDAQALIEEIG